MPTTSLFSSLKQDQSHEQLRNVGRTFIRATTIWGEVGSGGCYGPQNGMNAFLENEGSWHKT